MKSTNLSPLYQITALFGALYINLVSTQSEMVYALNGVAHGILVHIAYANSEGLSGPLNLRRLVRAFAATRQSMDVDED